MTLYLGRQRVAIAVRPRIEPVLRVTPRGKRLFDGLSPRHHNGARIARPTGCDRLPHVALIVYPSCSRLPSPERLAAPLHPSTATRSSRASGEPCTQSSKTAASNTASSWAPSSS